jgi:hypothetical protein
MDEKAVQILPHCVTEVPFEVGEIDTIPIRQGAMKHRGKGGLSQFDRRHLLKRFCKTARRVQISRDMGS